jgi:protein-S-isoprenylcysteine O-methyltransferase Ste14
VPYPLHVVLLSGLWLAWAAIWFIAALNVKAARRTESFGARALYLAPLFAAVALMLSRRLPFAWLYLHFLPTSATIQGLSIQGFGIILVVAGLGFAVWARLHLGRNWSSQITLKQDHELIRSGPYGVVRHPIYSGLLVAVLGTAITIGEWRGLVALACVLLGVLRKLGVEERWLSELFPDAYARYRREVPALVPFIY